MDHLHAAVATVAIDAGGRALVHQAQSVLICVVAVRGGASIASADGEAAEALLR